MKIGPFTTPFCNQFRNDNTLRWSCWLLFNLWVQKFVWTCLNRWTASSRTLKFTCFVQSETQYNTMTTNRLCKIAHLVLSYNYMIGLVHMQKLWSNQQLQDICPCSTRQLPTGGPFSTLELLAKINHIARAMKPAPWMICAMLWGSSKSICDAQNVSFFWYIDNLKLVLHSKLPQEHLGGVVWLMVVVVSKFMQNQEHLLDPPTPFEPDLFQAWNQIETTYSICMYMLIMCFREV